jgi:hypothetical protein
VTRIASCTVTLICIVLLAVSLLGNALLGYTVLSHRVQQSFAEGQIETFFAMERRGGGAVARRKT